MAKRNTDYGEIFCEAVQNIVNGEVSKLSYDISRECTIVEVIDKAFGKYRVSDGSINFIALASQGAFYEVNDTVLVTIPQGDYNKQINIVNKIVDEWSGPAGFVRLLDTIVKCTDNLVIGATSEKLIANGGTKSKSILSLSQKKLLGFTKIGIAAKFKSLVDEALEGDYGLKFTITADKNKVAEFLFSCADMLGNPYKFTSWFSQEYAFDIPDNFQKVTGITVSFYQNSNFKDGNNNYLPVSKVNNLFVKDLEIYFGYDKDIDFKEIVEIFSDDLTYAGNLGDNKETKEISLQWIHKVGDNRLQQITNINENDDYHIQWYRFTPGHKEIDSYAGENWELLDDKNKFTIKGPVRATRPTEKFKAICFVDTYPLINDPTYKVVEYYSSNILTFENTNQETSGGEFAADVIQNNLSFHYSDGMFGNYFLYDQNGFLIDSANQGTSKNRTVEIYYKNTEINEDSEIYNLASYKWTVPDLKKQPFSMIVYDEDQSLKTNKFNYSINNSYNSNFTDNNISCTITIDNQNYVLNDVLRFGPRGSNGTNNTFFIEMLDGKNAVTIGDTNGLRLQAILIDPSGKQIYFTSEEAKNISWEIINDDKKYLKKSGSGQVITLTTTSTTVPKDHYAILKASYKYETGETISPTLEAYLPIPIKSNNCKSMIGTNQILYNHQGIPNYGNTAYVAINNKNEEAYEWEITTDDTNPNDIRLKTLDNNKKGLVVNSQLYFKKEKSDGVVIQDKVCVYNEGLWSQPILVMQTQYDFAMLNSWDGKLTIDEDNGIILSTMLGAGRKNSQNQFSGVLIGDVKGGSGLQSTEHKTGVYGFQDGVMSYGLREDGTAFFGASGKGRVEIDGTSGIIRSAGWNKSGNSWTLSSDTGTLIDLDDGMLLMKGKNSYLYFNEDKDNTLKMSLSGANIYLTDKTNNISTYIDVTAEGINANVTAVDGKVSQLAITVNGISTRVSNAEGNISTLTQTVNGIKTTVEDNAGNISTLTQNTKGIKANAITRSGTGFTWNLDANGFYLNNGTTANNNNYVFKCDKDGIKIKGNAEFTGKVTATSGEIGGCKIENGTLKVSAANITGKLEADQINADFITVNEVKTTYATIANLNTVKATVDTINANYVTTSTLSAHTISADKITTGKLQNAITLDGNGIIYAGDLMLGSGGLSYVGGFPFITISNGVIGSFSKVNVNTISSNGNNSITFNNTIYVPNQSYISIGGTTLYNYIAGIVGQMRP